MMQFNFFSDMIDTEKDESINWLTQWPGTGLPDSVEECNAKLQKH